MFEDRHGVNGGLNAGIHDWHCAARLKMTRTVGKEWIVLLTFDGSYCRQGMVEVCAGLD